MFDKLSLDEWTKIQNDYFVTDILMRSSDDTVVIYVPGDRVSEVVKPGHVSIRQLEALADDLSKSFRLNTEVIYTRTDKLELFENAFKTLIKVRFDDVIESIHCTFFTHDRVNVWLKSTTIGEHSKKEIEAYVADILIKSEVSNISIQWIEAPQAQPTPIDIVKAVKKLQPVNIDDFISEFSNRGIEVDRSWLNRNLDKMIKTKLLVRDADTKRYALTGKGLGVIPDGLSRNNSDILRALALGKRKW